MEVLQETYKDTKIGRIPKDWEVVRLEEVLIEFQNGYAFSSKGYQESGIPIVSMAYIGLEGKFKFNYKKANYWSEKERENLSRYLLKKEDLIIAMTDVTPNKNLIGRMVQIDIDDEFFLNQRVGLLRCNNRIEKNFLMYLGNSKIWRSYAIGYSTLGVQTNLGTKEIKKGRIPLPPLPEQQKIAAILSTVDEQISTTDKIIEKSKELKKGLMQKLFSEGIGHTEFKDTKIGRIPKDWNTLKINQVADCYGGTTPSTTVEEYWNGDILWATPSDITKNKSEYLLNTSRKITEQGRASKNLRFVKKNGLLMTSRASIGFLNISNGDVVTNQGFINIECKDNFHYKFFYYWVLDNRKKLLSLSQGSTFLELYRKTFSKISILTPPLPEQQKIADILSEVDAKIENEQAKKEQLEALKKGLMQQLLTGKKRVKV